MTSPNAGISIVTSVLPTVATDESGYTLFLTRDTTQDADGPGKISRFENLAAVGNFFGTVSEPYRAARRYFLSDPYPKPLLVGRWNIADVNHEIRGGAPSSVATIILVSDGSLALDNQDIGPIDFSGAADEAAIAALLQTAIRAARADWVLAGVAFASGRYTVSFPPTVSLPDAQVFVATGSGTDASSLLGLDANSGAELHKGAEAETIEGALTALAERNRTWTLLALESSINNTGDEIDASDWCNGGSKKILCAEANGLAVLVTNEANSNPAQLAGSEWTNYIYSRGPDYKGAGIAAKFSAVNYALPGSHITLKYKLLEGCERDILLPAQRNELNRKRVNHYTDILAEGYSLSPNYWADQRYWLSWFEDEVTRRLFSVLRRRAVVPYTNAGVADLVNEVESVCLQGLVNGGLAAGDLEPEYLAHARLTTGDPGLSATTPGYLVYAQPVTIQQRSQVQMRSFPSIFTWLVSGGAIHGAGLVVLFQQR